MPELPEVETTVRGLNKTVAGSHIQDMWWDWNGMFRGLPPAKLKKIILGKKIVRAERRAKNILLCLSDGHTLLIHLKMTGHLMYGKWERQKGKTKNQYWIPTQKTTGPLHDPFNRFIHVLWDLDDGSQLAFCDMRKFGKIEYVKTAESHAHARLAALGPEPLSPITPKEFAARLLRKPSGKIKTVLMDQSVIAGIGNIYADEILWVAGVHPESKVSAIPKKILEQMRTITKNILEHSLKIGGDSKSDYRNIFGERGGFQNVHKAYHRTGQRCLKKNCPGTIERKVVNSRSSHFCCVHQKKY